MKNQLPEPDDNQLHQTVSKPPGRRSVWYGVSALAVMGAALTIWRSPPYSFHPMCTYTVNAVISADVDIAGQKLTSSVVYQNSHSRGWIAGLNSAGCQQTEGTALVFKLANDNLLIVPSRLCRKAEQALESSGQVDVLGVCTQKQAHQDAAFMVDSATRPTKWFKVRNGSNFRITKMTAVSTWSNPADDIATLAPQLLKSTFKYDRQQWSQSPEKVISFHRRYNLRKQKTEPPFEYVVRNEQFDLRQ
jgi:hypothetical protein